MNSTKITESISYSKFKEILEEYKSKIHISPHALEHLSISQRKLFKEEVLINTLLKEKPAGIGLQRNGRYAVFFRKDNYYLRIICTIKKHKFEIITFLNTDNIPNLKRLRK